MIELIEKLKENNLTISTMESCTGGGLVNAITNIEGASEVLKFSAVTYSNEYKIKMGVDKNIIDKYSVYSKETAQGMAYNISKFSNADIGVGITGKINRLDKSNDFGKDNEVFFSIYFKDKYYDFKLEVTKQSRKENKDIIIDKIVEELKKILCEV